MADKDDSRVFGIKCGTPEKRQRYQEILKESGMKGEDFLDNLYAAFERERRFLSIAEVTPDFGIALNLTSRLLDQAAALAASKSELVEKHAAEKALWQDQLTKVLEEKARDNDSWEVMLAAERENADMKQAEVARREHKAAEAESEVEQARARMEEERLQTKDILFHQKSIIEQQRNNEEQLRSKLQEVVEQLDSLSGVVAERDRLMRELADIRLTYQHDLSRAKLEIQQQYLDKREAAADGNSRKPPRRPKPTAGGPKTANSISKPS